MAKLNLLTCCGIAAGAFLCCATMFADIEPIDDSRCFESADGCDGWQDNCASNSNCYNCLGYENVQTTFCQTYQGAACQPLNESEECGQQFAGLCTSIGVGIFKCDLDPDKPSAIGVCDRAKCEDGGSGPPPPGV